MVRAKRGISDVYIRCPNDVGIQPSEFALAGSSRLYKLAYLADRFDCFANVAIRIVKLDCRSPLNTSQYL